ncbi:CerR family C-terminal domain-containing protein [Asaia astilbis]|uniref:CerR family C-terminal domain-containing protein n=1 Tax=Asaia astilbis TaxID=610244 RepID=UPI0004706D99|nr:CerR family C-terminal domain-containing protein [Asaia astilbis]
MDGEKSSSLRRRPAKGGYVRGEAKRITIIEAAIRCFGELGFAGATTRAIARAAGVNPPALEYYFNDKAGLYEACRQHVFKAIYGLLEERGALLVAETVDRPEDAMQALEVLLDALTDVLLIIAERHGWRRLFVQLRIHESGKAEGARFQPSHGLFERCSDLAAKVMDLPADDNEVKLRTAAALGLLMTFHLEFEMMMARCKWRDLEEPRLTQLKKVIRQSARSILLTPNIPE